MPYTSLLPSSAQRALRPITTSPSAANPRDYRTHFQSVYVFIPSRSLSCHFSMDHASVN